MKNFLFFNFYITIIINVLMLKKKKRFKNKFYYNHWKVLLLFWNMNYYEIIDFIYISIE